MPTFDGKSEIFELFADLFQTILKIHNQLTEEDKKNYLHPLMRGDVQKHQQPEQRKSSRNSDCLPHKIREIPVNSYSKTQSSTSSLQSSEPEFNWLIGRTPETIKGCIRSCRSSNYNAIPLFQNVPTFEEIDKPGAFGEWHVRKHFVASWKGKRFKGFGGPR